MNIEKITELFTSLSPLKINNDFCVKIITPKASCSRCSEVCPKQCLSFKNNSWHVDDCIYCGLCVAVCPNNVFNLDEEYLLSQCSSERDLVITCKPMLEQIKEKKTDILQINCFAQLYPELLLKLINYSNQLVLILDREKCVNCLNFNIDSLLKQLKEYPIPIEKLFITNSFKRKKKAVSKDNNQPPNSRRLFLRSVFDNSKKLPHQLMASVFASEEVEKDNLSDNHETTLKIKRKHISDVLKNTIRGTNSSKLLPYRKLQVATCNFCGACHKLCPAKALVIENVGDTKNLLYYPQLCTECNICKDICFFQAFDWAEQLTVEEFSSPKPQILASASKKTCLNCEQDFWQTPETKRYCLLCSRLENTDNQQ